MSPVITDSEKEQPIVYVVDDDKSVRDSLDDLLASVGLRATLFASSQEFVRSERPDAPACLVLDVRMPGLSGLGSGLIDQSRKITLAAMQMADMKVWAHRS